MKSDRQPDLAGHIFKTGPDGRTAGYSLCWGESQFELHDIWAWFYPGIRRTQSLGLTDGDKLCRYCYEKSWKNLKPRVRSFPNFQIPP